MLTKIVSILTLTLFFGIPATAIIMGLILNKSLLIADGGVLLVIGILSGFFTVPTIRAGLYTRFQKRTGRKIKEGLGWAWPIIEEVQVFSLELQTEKLDVEIFTIDEIEATLHGSYQWKPCFDRLIRHAEMSLSTIKDGIADAVRSELTGVGSTIELDDIIARKGALELLVDCVLRLEKAPHHHLNRVKTVDPKTRDEIVRYEFGDTLKKWFDDGAKEIGLKPEKIAEYWGKLSPEKWEIPTKTIRALKATQENEEKKKEPEIRLDAAKFYELNVSRIKIIQELGTRFNDVSPVEERHGIDVVKYQLTNYNFSLETEKAIEKRRQSSGIVEAAKTLKGFVKETVVELKKEGVPPGEAATTAKQLMNIPGVQEVALTGKGGGLPLVNIDTKGSKGGEK